MNKRLVSRGINQIRKHQKYLDIFSGSKNIDVWVEHVKARNMAEYIVRLLIASNKLSSIKY
ncbi:protein of unknown function [Oenococcus oeni]|uniref:hypothetical protein n=1 Tax=Oenococcus oeni TaxID=1247 RepID=UPI0010780D8A|nr:hypothetical protein [Oenococcus oeni]AVI94088.1 hypothetical protein AX764_04240 [Oenococcus oeni]SYV99716.1 hypothetical protein OENI_20099 [Oenococcus oeni]SYW03894.1 hypothetical protein OENI_90037 [Oenococcus oeni]SYW17670.1 hypothetical protein OENI_10338 [Oenococcus oeni]VDC14605.1 protein of unknown function [Oenococcus oeni]